MSKPGAHQPPPTCALCHRHRRNDRPLCNNHMRHTGQPNLDAYFVRVRSARGKAPDSPEVQRLAETIDAMLVAARQYAAIRETGYKPYWNAGLGCWQHPRQRAHDILRSYYRRHRFYLDEAADMQILERMAAELVPRLP